MVHRCIGVASTLLALAACAGSGTPDDAAETAPPTAQPTSASQQALQCTPSPDMELEGRASPYDSVSFALGGEEALICYGRPSAQGRDIFGGLVPYDRLWRTGANEPTIIHLPFAARIAGVEVEPGSYSLYTVPGEEEWTVVVNHSTSQWGHESQYTPEVEAQEVGRATVPASSTDAPVEVFTIQAEPASGQATDLVLEWENTRVEIPVERI